ncbi:M23 family metallopeptidase [candidate division KSB1 bacterium]|nr:M23 family metallopeptidase [candidate division KSB1 bacterium]
MKWFTKIVIGSLLGAGTVWSQVYLWPTNASHLLSASFAEYRPNHFHAGIDIKTLGITGYPVYAIRSGYIEQLKVSPYGYGRVLYQRLDTGEIVVYGHLEHFSLRLDSLTRAEQLNKRQFSVNRYFQPNDFPVEQGEIIAFTGESGIGPPHLHFEIRDQYNNPLNPLSKGYSVKDTRRPIVNQLAMVPLNPASEINGAFERVLVTPRQIAPGKYQLDQIFQFGGQIGLAVAAYDPIDLSQNELGLFSIKLYLDDELKFAARYDKFSYTHTQQIYLDRDYRLLRMGDGVFQKCYRDVRNELEFYVPFPPGAGIIDESLNQPPSPTDIEPSVGGADAIYTADPRSTNPAQMQKHQFRIELADFHENTTTVTGQFWLGKPLPLAPQLQIDPTGNVQLINLSEPGQAGCRAFTAYISSNQGLNWQPVYSWRQRSSATQTNRFATPVLLTKLSPADARARILKMTGTDRNGLPMLPYFQVLQPSRNRSTGAAYINVKKTFYDDFVVLNLEATTPVLAPPQVTVLAGESTAISIPLQQTGLRNFVGILPLQPTLAGIVNLEILAESADRRGMYYSESIRLLPINAPSGGIVRSQDNRLELEFIPDGVYQTVYVRIDEIPINKYSGFEQVGRVYQIEPYTVPLKEKVKIRLTYPLDYPQPEKLGIYQGAPNQTYWRLVGNLHDFERGTINATINAFGTFTLIKDVEPPELTLIWPTEGAQTSNRLPRFQVKLLDRLSGIEGDIPHLQLFLDDQKLIAEFDPERSVLFFQTESPLPKGRHGFKIYARDRSGNAVEKSVSFWVM